MPGHLYGGSILWGGPDTARTKRFRPVAGDARPVAWRALGRHFMTAALTHSTSGRCDASSSQLSPSSALAYTSPLRLPK